MLDSRNILSQGCIVTEPASFTRLKQLEFPTANTDRTVIPKIRLLQDGNPDNGDLTIIKQIHPSYCENFHTLEKIGLYQSQIYKSLITTLPHHHIFVEGLQTDFPNSKTPEFNDYCYTHLWSWPSLREKTDANNCVAYIHSKFSNYSASNPTNEQLQYLGALGAATIFAICYTNVQLHRTTDPEFENKLTEIQTRHKPHLPFGQILNNCCVVRERRAFKEIHSFLIRNPGTHVDLVFGNLHKFNLSLDSLRGVVVNSISWPRLTSQLGWISEEPVSQN